MANLERRGDNTFRVRISNGFDIDGKRIVVKRSFSVNENLTEKQKLKEAEMIAAQLEAEVKRGTFLDAGKMTFAEFVEEWRKRHAERHLQPKTYFRYMQMLESRIIPALGHVKLEKLQPTMLLDFYDNLKEAGIRLEDDKYIPKSEFMTMIESKGLSFSDLKRQTNLYREPAQRIKDGQAISKKAAQKICSVTEFSEAELFDVEHNEKPLSDRTVLHHHRLISSILTCAVQWQLLASNPATRVKAPRVEKKEAKHFNEEQTMLLLEYADNEVKKLEEMDIPEYEKLNLEFRYRKYQATLYIALYGGLREGEIAGVKWVCIDFDNNTLEVKIATQYVPGKGSFEKTPKNESSQRIISLPSVVMEVLRQYKNTQTKLRLLCGEAWTNTDYVFTQSNGKAVHPSWATKWFPKYIAKYNKSVMENNDIPEKEKEKYLVPIQNFHTTRHTNATLLISDGVNLKTVSSRLGHSNTSTTMNIYSHSLRNADKEAADRLEGMLVKKKDAKGDKLKS